MSDKWGEGDHLDARDGDEVDRYDAVDDGGEEWYEVSRRYRRGLGGWWWLALLAIPLLLALLGSLLDKGGDEPAEEKTTTAAETSSSVQDSGDAVAADSVSYEGDKDKVTFTASAPSESDKDALVKAVEDANEGRTVDAQVSVDEKAPLVEGAQLGALTNALKAGGEGLTVSGDASALTLSGEVADEAARKTVAKEFATVYPDARITDELTVGGKPAPAEPSPSEPAASSKPAEPSPSQSSSEAPEPSASEPTESSKPAEPSPTAEPSTSEPTESSAPEPSPTSEAPKPEPTTPKPSPSGPAPVSAIGDLTCENAKVSMDRVNAANPIRFPSSSDALYGDSALAAGQIGAKLAGCDFDVVVIGHTDNVGGDVNEKLSAYRAEKVAQALVVAGVDNSRIEQKNAAASQPVASNKTEDGRAKNRRVTIQVK